MDTTEKGVFCLDASMREVVVKGRRIRLSQMEFRVLNVLMERPRVCYSGEELFKKVWGVGGIGDRKTVQVHIHNLRRKIEEDPENPCYLKSERGRGYWLEVEKKENKD